MPEPVISTAVISLFRAVFAETELAIVNSVSVETMDAATEATAAGLRSAIAQYLAEQVGVPVDPTDLRIVLDQQSGHAHRRPGIWDPDNLPDRANKRCVECAARERLREALDSQAATPASAGEPKEDR